MRQILRRLFTRKCSSFLHSNSAGRRFLAVYSGGETEPTQSETMASKTVEAVVCNVNDMKDGEMKEVDVGDTKALLIRDGDNFHAIGTKCTHYGASLVNGVYCNGRVRCPWHGACFNVRTGDIEEFPGLDGLPKFEVSVANGKVKVKASPDQLASKKIVKAMKTSCTKDSKVVLIVGGGPASVTCAETLRQEGFEGKIIIATMEKCLPYDRPKLSKAMSSTPDEIALRKADFYKTYSIEVQFGKEATSVDPGKKSVAFKDGSSIKFDSLLLATGGRPRVLPIPGIELENVCQLRTPSDANNIAAKAKGKHVVIIGSSFIGMEVASCLVDKAASVSVVDIIKVPFQLVLGEKVGTVLQKLHEEKGVKFHFEASIAKFEGANGKVKEAVLSTGARLPADIAVMGVGVVPATDFLKGSGIDMTSRGFLTVCKHLKTNKAGIFAAGDIVEFPLFTVGGAQANVQHWQMANAHGRHAAFSILGKERELRSVPYFWTAQYGKSIRYTGYGPGYDDIIVHGDLSKLKFVAYYTKGDKVQAVASMNYDPIVSQAAEMFAAGKSILKSEVKDDPTAWVKRLQQK